MVVDPDCSVDGGADEHAATRPTMDIVELLVAMSRSKDQREDRVLRSEEEDEGELSQREETWIEEADKDRNDGNFGPDTRLRGWGW